MSRSAANLTDHGDVPNPVEALADEFVRRTRLGERPSLAEYCERFPQYADEIRRLFPTVMFLEQLKPSTGELQTARLRQAPAHGAAPEHLGDFQILREIGRGGMGIVYEAEQQSLGRRVAIKVLAQANSQDEKHVARFEREARSAARLHHTNIVPVFGVGAHEGIRFLVMQLIPGQGIDHVLVELRRLRHLPDLEPEAASRSQLAESMAQALQSGTFHPKSEHSTDCSDKAENHSAAAPIHAAVGAAAVSSQPARAPDLTVIAPELGSSTSSSSTRTGFGTAYWRSVARMGIDVARALEHAHSQGVLHRDIKPSNLLLDVHGAVWVADFGLAKVDDSGSLTLTGEFVGTLRYMAPERFRGQYDERSDLYGLGLTLYELLTLAPAFDATDRGLLISQVMQSRPRPIHQIDASIPADLATIVAKAVAANPDERYQSAAALADDMQRFLDDVPIAARPTSALERLWRSCRRNPAIASFVATSILLLVAWGTTSSILAVRLDAAREDALSEGRIAERRRDEAETNRRVAVRRGAEAQASAEESRQNLVRLHVSHGARLLEEGDPLGSLPHFANALVLDAGDAERERTHRIRLQATVRYAPRLVAATSGRSDSEYDQASHDGKLFASGPAIPFRNETVLAPFALFNEIVPPGSSTVVVSEIPSCQPVCRLEHGNQVLDYAFSPDSRSIATGTTDGLVRVWDARTGELRVTTAVPHPGLRALALGGDGAFLISAGVDERARVWDSATGELLSTVVLPNRSSTVSVDPHGGQMAVNSEHRVEIRDLATGRQVGDPILGGRIFHAEYVRDGRELVVVGESPFARRFDAQTGKLISSSPGSKIRPQESLKPSLKSSSDGRWILEDVGRALYVWDNASGTIVNPRLAWPRTPAAAMFNAAGDRVGVLAIDTTFSVWEPQSGELLIPPVRHSTPLASASITDDNRYLLTRGRDRSLRLWDVAGGNTWAQPIPESMISWKRRTYSPDGRLTLGFGRNLALIRETNGGTVVARLGNTFTNMAHEFTADGRFVLAGSPDGSIRMWNAQTGAPTSEMIRHPANLSTATVSLDGARVATLAADGIIRVWNPAQPARPVCEFFVGGSRFDITLSPAATHLVTRQQLSQAGGWHIDSLYDARDGRLIGEYPRPAGSQSLAPIVFSDDGKLWLSASSEELIVRDAESGRSVANFGPQPELAYTANFLRHDAIVTGSRDGIIRVWDVGTSRLVYGIQAHSGRIFSVASDASGKYFVSVAGDLSCRVWEVATGEIVTQFKHSAMPAHAWFLPGALTVVTVDLLGAVRRWDLEPDARPAADWVAIAELLSGKRVSPAGENVTRSELTDAAGLWNRLRTAYPAEFTASAAEEENWLRQKAAEAKSHATPPAK